MEGERVMATCKECIHYDLCMDRLSKQGYSTYAERNLIVEDCEFFKNKACFVEVKSCDVCIFLDVPAGHMPCIECSNYYISQFKQK